MPHRSAGAERIGADMERVTEILLVPEGRDADDDEDLRYFSLTVRWRGPRTETGRGGYAVQHGNRHLSTAGNWRYEPEPRLQRHYRWDTLEEALAAAREALPTVTFNGRTWAEWRALRQETNGW